MPAVIKALLLLTTLTAASLRSCDEQYQPEGKSLHRPSKIDSVAIREEDHDSLRIWDLTDSLREPYEGMRRMRTVPTRIFQQYNDSLWRSQEDGGIARIADSLGVQRITKADFDGNGLTDMIMFFGGWPIVILDDGNNNYRAFPLILSGSSDRIYPIIHRTNGLPEIQCYYSPWDRGGMRLPGDKIPPLKVDTLVYYKGDFIEKNANPTTYRIESIHLSQGCSHLCAPFDLLIDSAGNARYVSGQTNENAYWKDTTGTTIDRRTLDSIHSLLSYIDFPRLQDSYTLNGTDQQDYTTIITYDGGKTKTIGDYGQVGTYGLARLYYQLIALRSSQKWTKVGESAHRKFGQQNYSD